MKIINTLILITSILLGITGMYYLFALSGFENEVKGALCIILGTVLPLRTGGGSDNEKQ